jgi:Uma2 family endonuclease
MTVSKRDSQYHTYGDYLIWSRTYGDELLDGTAYVREPPSPTWSHQSIVGEIYHQIRIALKRTQWRACIAPLDVRLPKSNEPDEEVDTVVQPDVFITGDVKKIDQRGLRGAPDWLAEVLSPGTARYDRRKKIPVYERAGVPEVWLIDFNNRTVAIYRLSAGRYGSPTIVGLQGKTQLAAVPGITIHWDPIAAQVLDT